MHDEPQGGNAYGIAARTVAAARDGAERATAAAALTAFYAGRPAVATHARLLTLRAALAAARRDGPGVDLALPGTAPEA